MGTPEFSTKVLDALVNSEEYQVIAVVTQPDRPVGRKKVITPSPVKKYALEQNIAVYQPEKLTGSEELEQLMTLEADLIVTAAYGQFLPKKFLEFPKQGAVNVHASLLPKYRGGAPIHYAIMNGDSHTGVASMFEKLSVVGAELLLDTLPQIFDGTITEIVQDEELVTYSPNITREQEQIDWTKEAKMVDCFIRGLRPWPTSFTVLKGERVKIWQVKLVDKMTNELPGTLFKENHHLYVACGNQTVLEIIELQPAGKAKMSSDAFMNGFASVIEEKACFEGVNHG